MNETIHDLIMTDAEATAIRFTQPETAQTVPFEDYLREIIRQEIAAAMTESDTKIKVSEISNEFFGDVADRLRLFNYLECEYPGATVHELALAVQAIWG